MQFGAKFFGKGKGRAERVPGLFEILGKMLFKFVQLGRNNQLTIGLVGIVVVVVFVVILGREKGLKRHDLRHDRRIENFLFFQIAFGRFGNFLLFGVVVKNNRTVLRAHIVALAIELCGIMNLPENVQDLFVRDDVRIKLHLHDFGVTGCTG